mgnify:CR=1 FL=1
MRDNWVEDTVMDIGIVLILAVLMLSLVAPVLGPWIRARKVREYAMYPDWEQRVKDDMPWVYGGLTVWALIAWGVLIALS